MVLLINTVRGSSNYCISVDEAQVFYHSNESNLGVLSCSAVFLVFAITIMLDEIFVYVFKFKFTWQYQGNSSIIISTDVSGAV